MTEIDFNRIPRYRVVGDDISKLRPGDKICYGVSTLWSEQQGHKAIGIIGLLSRMVKEQGVKIHVLINDSGNRYAYQVNDGKDEWQAHRQAADLGLRWIDEYGPYFEYFGIPDRKDAERLEDYTFQRWEYYLRNPRQDPAHQCEIDYTIAAHQCLARLDPQLSAGYAASAQEFMNRPSRTDVSPEQFKLGLKLSREFLIEETALLAMLGRRYSAVVYPRRNLKCHEQPAKGEYNISDMLTWDELPDSVRAIAQPNEKPKETLLRAACGFENMRWIHIRRDTKRSLKVDVDKLRNFVSNSKKHHSITGWSVIPVPTDTPADMHNLLARLEVPERTKALKRISKK